MSEGEREGFRAAQPQLREEGQEGGEETASGPLELQIAEGGVISEVGVLGKLIFDENDFYKHD